MFPLILILIGIMFFAMFYYFTNIKKEVVTTTPIVCFNGDYDANTIITSDMLVVRDFDNKTLEPMLGNVLGGNDASAIIGYMTTAPVSKNEPVGKNRILDLATSAEYKGKKLIGYKMSELDKALLLKRGDTVDIWQVPLVDGFAAKKIYKNVPVMGLVNADYIGDKLDLKLPDGETFVPEYMLTYFTDKEIEFLKDINTEKVSLALSKHNPDKSAMDTNVPKESEIPDFIQGVNENSEDASRQEKSNITDGFDSSTEGNYVTGGNDSAE